MNVTPIKTDKVTEQGNILHFIDRFVPTMEEMSVLIITSKIVSILEGNTIPTSQVDKETLIEEQAEQYIPAASSRYHVALSISQNILIANSGLDESNGNDQYILWPKDPYKTAALVWDHIKIRDQIKKFGVIISDSRITPMRWGTIGVGLSYCGFEPLRSYIGQPDIFGRNLVFTKSSILDGLAGAGVLVMGEGNEQTPLAVINDLSFIEFTTRQPTPQDVKALRIEPEDDLFAPLLMSAQWQKKK